MVSQEPEALPRLILRSDSSFLELLRFIQRLLLQDPQAMQPVVQSLVTEGRAFAETPEGQHLKTQLAKSELVRRGRLIWETYGLDTPPDTEPALLPSDWLNVLATEAVTVDLEETLKTLILESVANGTVPTE